MRVKQIILHPIVLLALQQFICIGNKLSLIHKVFNFFMYVFFIREGVNFPFLINARAHTCINMTNKD